MDAILVGIAAVFGLIVGSFLNVVIYRLPRDLDMVWARSQCPSCGKMIVWFDNVPLLSYLWLLGKCRRCSNRIGWRYPLVEGLTGGLFGLAMAHALEMPGPQSFAWMVAGFVLMAAFLAALTAATFIDLEHRILPDEITKTGMWAAPVASLVFPWTVLAHFPAERLGFADMSPHVVGLLGSLAGMLLGAGSIWGIAILGKWVFRKEAMGFGDVKFMGLIGGFLGPIPVVMVFFLACVFGSLVGITSFLITRSRYMAFGPYLALGAAIMLLEGKFAVWVAIEWWPRFVTGLFG